jgi:hypothetical protein
MKTPKLTAMTVRSLLSVLLVAVVVAIVAGFYFGLGEIKKFADEVSVVTSQAAALNSQSGTIPEATAQDPSLAKAGLLFVSEPQWQAQARQDIEKYAADSGLTAASIGFETDTPPLPNQRNIVVSLSSPMNYQGLLRFLNAVETNLPKMQVTKLNISRESAGEVAVEAIVIGVSVR